jgi:glycosyltransferase involved in cell wall biosynthesis
VKITACLIVKNEAQVITRCLDSLAGIVDDVIVVDTGSTDDTVQLVNDHQMPSTVYLKPWVNFGHNRSELLRLARDAADWLLLVDADHEVQVTGSRPDLDEADAWLIEHNTNWRYSVPRLVRGGLPWRYEGVTHEYLSLDGATDYHRAGTDWLTIRDHADGGSRHDKFERDLRLLTDHHLEHPDDARTVFYLARTNEDIGQWDVARRWYEKRAQMDGWEEERWWAQYRAAWMRAYTDPLRAVAELWIAYETRPTRAEPLARLGELAAMNNWQQLIVVTTHLRKMRPPVDDILFVEVSDYLGG